jgi:hypothetical protein
MTCRNSALGRFSNARQNVNAWLIADRFSAMNDPAAACFDRKSKLQPKLVRSSERLAQASKGNIA